MEDSSPSEKRSIWSKIMDMKIFILLFLVIFKVEAAPSLLLQNVAQPEIANLKTQLLNSQSILARHVQSLKIYVETSAEYSQAAIENAESSSLVDRLSLEIVMNQKALNLASMIYLKNNGASLILPSNYSENSSKVLIRERLFKFKDSLSRSHYLLSINSAAINIQMILLIELAKKLNYLSSAEVSLVEQRISNLTSDLRENYRILRATEQNNHSLRTASAIGIGGLYFNKQDWIDIGLDVFSSFSLTEAPWTYQTSHGGYAEGMNYFTYAIDLLMPFMNYYEELKNQYSLSSSFRVRRVFEWSLHSTMPDGLRPPIDNGNVSPDPSSGYLFNHPNYPAYIQQSMEWDYQKNLFQYPSLHQVILLFKNMKLSRSLSLTPHSSYGSYFNPIQGTAFLRSGTTLSDDYLMIIGENGVARSHGGAHESVDNGAYLFWSGGDAITTQPGYFGFKRVNETNKAIHHSIPLINGDGPNPPIKIIGYSARGEDAFMSLISLQSYRVKSNYIKTDVTREFKHYPKGILKITDNFYRTWIWGKANFSSPIHLNAGRGFDNQVVSVNGAQCFRTLKFKKFACVAFFSPQGINLSRKTFRDMFTGIENDHIALVPEHHARISSITTVIAVGETTWPEITSSQGRIFVSRDGQNIELK